MIVEPVFNDSMREAIAYGIEECLVEDECGLVDDALFLANARRSAVFMYGERVQ
jgi:hypothetical protein